MCFLEYDIVFTKKWRAQRLGDIIGVLLKSIGKKVAKNRHSGKQ